MYYNLIYCLQLLKMFHDIGIYEGAAGDIKEITGDDYYELILRGFESVAPAYEMEELGEEVCCGGHIRYHFSDPSLVEYYRLCRLYEFRQSISPEDNPYVIKADNYYVSCLENTSGAFGSDYDDERHPKEIWIETCPEREAYEHEIIELVHNVMEFYRSEVETLRAELLRRPVVWLPALPPHIGSKRRRKPSTKKGKALKKAA